MKNPGTLKRILTYLGRRKFLIALSIVFAGISVALTLYLPKVFGDVIDTMTGKGRVDFKELFSLFILAGAVIGATALTNWLMSVINNRITFGVARDIRNTASAKLHRLPLSYLDSHPAGDTVSRIIADVDQFTDGLLMSFTQLFTGVITILGTVGFMIAIDWRIAAIVIVLTPLSLLLARFIASRTHSMFKTQAKVRGEQTAFIEEMTENQKIVRAFGMEEECMERFTEMNDRLGKAALKATFFSSLVNPTTRIIYNIIYAVVALTGALTVIGPSSLSLTVGGLSCLLAYATQYAKPFNEISGVIAELQSAFACAERVFELIDEKEEAPDGDRELGDCNGRVDFESVFFSYSPEKKLIEDLSISVKPGMRVAIVGPTGCGKTTLINLLMRFYDADSGCVRVDGKELPTLKRRSLRKNYGMVLQETVIRRGTVSENIAMGRPDATREEIMAAAKEAHAHGFIKRLPKGYDTVIGPDTGLSGGQRQLLCIARIMLTLPPMLILDEATSSIDTRTEMKIQDAFAKMMKGRTSFIVAHRLSTVRDADLILVMNNGTIIESGTHDSLIEAGGFYAKLYNSQFEN
ncbi:MAG: ABC transporter ATP-binding protein [Ruminococcaceae bacterium]|nr:ABC transporter ATP-binding protein [Oscillospiraceae bacterium]